MMKMKALYGSHSIAIAIIWYLLTIGATVFLIYREIVYHLDIFEFMDMNLLIMGLTFVGASYILEDLWLMTMHIHNPKYTKEGSRSYYMFSRFCGVFGFIFLAFYFVHKYVVI